MVAPIILREGRYDNDDLIKLKSMAKEEIKDLFHDQKKELAMILSPASLDSEELSYEHPEDETETSGDWIFFPWNGVLLRTVNEQELYMLKTNRNKNVITQEEQARLSDFTVAIAGLSVGSGIASTLVHNGFPKCLKLADFDVLETTNLNRLRARLADVGVPKLEIITRQLFDVDPHLNIVQFPRGIKQNDFSEFFGGDNPTKLVFEIIDDLKTKVLLRLEAKEQRVPLVMLTSIGDSLLIDVERYDTDPKTTPFNGLVNEDDIASILSSDFDKSRENEFVVKIVGRENIPGKVLSSVKEIGRTLVGRPQLMSTVTVEAGVAAYLARQIALGEPTPSGRSRIVFENFVHGG